jgi:hypothetical protein
MASSAQRQPKPKPEHSHLVAEPGPVGYPRTLCRDCLVEAIDGGVAKDRWLQAHAADRTGIGPDPVDKIGV